jgi:hypothetical protein
MSRLAAAFLRVVGDLLTHHTNLMQNFDLAKKSLPF